MDLRNPKGSVSNQHMADALQKAGYGLHEDLAGLDMSEESRRYISGQEEDDANTQGGSTPTEASSGQSSLSLSAVDGLQKLVDRKPLPDKIVALLKRVGVEITANAIADVQILSLMTNWDESNWEAFAIGYKLNNAPSKVTALTKSTVTLDKTSELMKGLGGKVESLAKQLEHVQMLLGSTIPNLKKDLIDEWGKYKTELSSVTSTPQSPSPIASPVYHQEETLATLESRWPDMDWKSAFTGMSHHKVIRIHAHLNRLTALPTADAAIAEISSLLQVP